MTGQTIVVVGGGIVGVCSALWIQRSGHRVILIDRAEPGSGTSSGNACTIADYACIPVNKPALRWQIPRLILAKNSPLTVDISFAASNLGWMLSFLKHCSRKQVESTVNGLARLLEATYDGLEPLVQQADLGYLFQRKGCLYAYQTEAGYQGAINSNRLREEQGVRFETLDGNQIKDLEPSLRTEFYRGLLFSRAQQVFNPKILIDKLFENFVTNGGEYIAGQVDAVEPNGTIRLADSKPIDSDKVVIAAGAFSRRIANAGIDQLPLGTERGYHVQFSGRQSLLQRPVAWAEAGFYATPTSEGLRFAGTVEIASLDKPANPANIEWLFSHAKKMFDLEEQPSQTWLGFRPTFPDALPVIGPSKVSKNILLAFGHQHVGLTLGGITGKLISELVDNKPPSIDLSPYSPQRFG